MSRTKKTLPRGMSIAILLVLLLILSVVSIFVGTADFSPSDLMHPTTDGLDLFLISRLPRLLSVIIAGSSMAVSGMILQTICHNRFVSPSLIGITSWTKLGILASLVFFLEAPSVVRMVFGFVASLLGTLLFMGVLNRTRFKNAIMVPLVGMMMGSVIEAVNVFFVQRFELTQTMESLVSGSFSLIIRGRYELLYIGIPVMVLAYLFANQLTISGMGERFSKNLGVNYRQVVFIGMVFVSLISAVVTSTVGVIPFIDLIVPNIIAMAKGDNLRGNLMETGLLGANFVLLSDLFSRVVMAPFEMPVSVTAGIIGSVLFVLMLLRRNIHA